MAAKSIFVVASLLLLSVYVCQAQLSTVNFGAVVENLARRFQEIRNEGLGINQLEKAYGNAPFTSDTLTPAQIESLISETDSSITESISSVIALFDSIVSGMSPNQNITPTDCCTTTGSSACCLQCESIDQTEVVERVAGHFSESSLAGGGQLYFGLNNGPIITYPPNPSTVNCTDEDSRIQPWFRRSFQKRLEVVIVADLTNSPFSFYTEANINALRGVATGILRSLTQGDRVAIVRADLSTRLPLVVSRLASDVSNVMTVPVCDDTITELEQFVTSVSELPSASVNLTAAFVESVSLFSDSPDTDKVLVTLLPGTTVVLTGGPLEALEQAVADRGNDIVVSSYRGVTSPNALRDFQSLSEVGLGGGVNEALVTPNRPPPPLPPRTGRFYSYFLSNEPVTVTDNSVGSDRDVSGRSVLTLSRPVINGSSLIGVLHAELPWEQLLSRALSELANRQSSYVFTVALDNNVLFHPSLPTGLLADVSVRQAESNDGIVTMLSNTSSSSTQSAALTKTLLVPTASTGFRAFVRRRVPSKYYCRRTHMMYVCLLLVDEDLTIATLDQQGVDVQGTYSSSSSRLPLYHNLMLSASSADTCDYFCKATLTNRISFQLTSPSQPPTADSQVLVQEVSRYIDGTGPRPSWVAEGVASEISLGSAVATSWMNTSTASDYITRRHLATPSGAYLTYPPTQFVSEYRPKNTDWYTAAQAHPSLLTLTPPQETLSEGSRLTVSLGYAVKSPSSGRGQTVSVVGADLTLNSLRAFVRESLPLCEQNNQVSCFIVDDLGNILYDDVLVRSVQYSGGARFLADNFGSAVFEERKSLIADLLNQARPGLLTKLECENYFVIGVETTRFYSLNVYHNNSVSSFGRNCIDYQIQRIPGTNAFMVALQRRRQCSDLCFCFSNELPQCLSCNSFSVNGCECPCVCRGECHSRNNPPVALTCPLSIPEANQEVVAQTATPLQETCFNQACNCRTTFDSCVGVRECSWCSVEQKCVYNTECCDPSSEDCCSTSPQTSRFESLTCSLRPVCSAGTDLTATCPALASPENSAVVVGGVIGGILAAVLVAFIVVLVVWYQVCRREDPKDEHSRESAFDFSNKRTEATNPTTSDIVSDDGTHKSGITNSSQAPLVDGGEKTDDSTTL